MHQHLINIWINNWSTYINTWSIQRSIYINKSDTIKLTILYYNLETYFYLLRQQNVMWKKQTTVKVKNWIKFPLKRMKLQSANLKQLSRSNFHNNLCRIGKWRKENWNKYNNIYLQKSPVLKLTKPVDKLIQKYLNNIWSITFRQCWIRPIQFETNEYDYSWIN